MAVPERPGGYDTKKTCVQRPLCKRGTGKDRYLPPSLQPRGGGGGGLSSSFFFSGRGSPPQGSYGYGQEGIIWFPGRAIMMIKRTAQISQRAMSAAAPEGTPPWRISDE